MFLLKTEDLTLQLEIVPVSSLVPHEQIISAASQRLAMEFSNLSNLHHPVIVDGSSIVLDGNHRVFVFNKLGFKHIAICRIDYFNRHVKLRYWFRLLGNLDGLGAILAIVEHMGGGFESVPSREVLARALAENRFSWGVQYGDQFGLIHFSSGSIGDAVDAYQALAKMQDILIKQGACVEYIPCNLARDTDTCGEIQKNDVVIWTPQVSKEMIVAAAKAGKVFAPKTTRHLIPARPLNVNIPGQWLKEDISLDEINQRFIDHLATKRIRKFGPGQVINGRFYGEKLFVFYD